MIDTHCHMDLYPDPTRVARESIRAGVGTVVVTNLPSAFERAFPFVGNVKGIKLALGLHPLVASEHARERKLFASLLPKTRYVGEVGLDFSREGLATKDIQTETFKFVLRSVKDVGVPYFLTIHSRRAEAAVLEMLDEEQVSPAVFHWFTGSLQMLNKAIEKGHFFSVNPAMVASPNGQRLVDAMPRERLLTESDGPFVLVGDRPARPMDVRIVRDYLSLKWKIEEEVVEQCLQRNFSALRDALGGLGVDATN